MSFILKKIIRSLFIISLLFTPILVKASNVDSFFYFKIAPSLNKISNNNSSKQKSIIAPTIGLGAGYYLNDQNRVELMFDYAVIKFKQNTDNSETNKITTDTSKTYIHSIMFNMYNNLYQTDNIKFFIGAGLGISHIHEKIKWVMTLSNGNKLSGLVPRKISYNFAYSVMVGTDFKVTPSVNIEVAYNWKDFGKTKAKTINDKVSIPTMRYNGHIGTIGIRYTL